MEELAASDTNTTNKQESHSIQTRLRKHFQKNRPFLGSKEQKGDSKKETAGRVQLKSKRRHVLDRVFSSSQPNLCCSGPNDNTGSGGQRDSRAGNKLLSEPKAATPQKQKAIFASVWSAVTHHKSSSECLKVPNRAEEVQSCSQPQAAVTSQDVDLTGQASIYCPSRMENQPHCCESGVTCRTDQESVMCGHIPFADKEQGPECQYMQLLADAKKSVKKKSKISAPN